MKTTPTSLKRRFISFLLAVAMMATCVSVNVVFASSRKNGSVLNGNSAADLAKYKLMKDVLESNFRKMNPTSYEADDEVIFIVKMSEKPVLEQKTQKVSLSEYLESAAGKTQLQKIDREQNSVLSVVRDTYGDSMQVLYRYSTIFNGFSVRTTYGQKETLEAIPGVESVSVAYNYVYMAPSESGYVKAEITSGETMQSDEVNEMGYTGKGTVTAILDTGLDVEHSAFSKAPQSPRLTAEMIAAISDLNAKADAQDLYVSEKIPFAYDYADEDLTVGDGEDHGTHVAGTVGADSQGFSGVAPDTQLVIMKVFGSTGGASSATILAALEDAVRLGVDTINMSLGTGCGFTTDYDDNVNTAYENVEAAGISLMCAAGNDYSSTYNNLWGSNLALLANPDNGIVGSPSTYGAAVSVASINEKVDRVLYFTDGNGERHIRYSNTATGATSNWDLLDGTFDLVVINNVGTVFDFENAETEYESLEGKVVLVKRGQIAFTEKEENAYNAGAAALIVYDNEVSDDLIYMQLNGLLPAICISNADGEYLRSLDEKKIVASPKFVDETVASAGGQMSDFSSLGVAPDLTLKPEITAPGGSVWSTLPGDRYGQYDGTSMASPHMAGAASVVREYVRTQFPEITDPEQQRDLINYLLLSTATQVIDPSGIAYTPRKQGAGLANVLGAVTTQAYLTVDGDRPQGELGYNEEGKFEFTFEIHNFGTVDRNYKVSVIPLVAKIETIDEVQYISEYSRLLTEAEFTVHVDKTEVSVAGGNSTAQVTVTLELTSVGKENLADFENGIFLDGFVVLEDQAEDGVDLSLPYLGFYGDWAKAPVFDKTMYDEEPAYMYDGGLFMLDSDYMGTPLGVNLLMDEDDFEAEKIVYGYNMYAQGYVVTPVMGLLRAPEMLSYQVSYPAGNQYIELAAAAKVMKSFYYTSGGYIMYDLLPPEYGFDLYNALYNFKTLNGDFSFDLVAQIAGTEEATQKFSIPFKVDSTAPEIVETEFITKDDGLYLKLTARDENGFLMAVQLSSSQEYRGEYIAYSDIITDESVHEAGADYVFEIPLSYAQYASMITGDPYFTITMMDYGMNGYESDVLPVSGSNEVTSVRINNRSITASPAADPMIISAYVEPVTAGDVELQWSTDRKDIITKIEPVEQAGFTSSVQITFGGAAGTAKLTAQAPNGVSDTIEILVTADPYRPDLGWDGKVHYNGVWIIPDGFNKTVQVLCDSNNPGVEPDVTLVGGSEEAPLTCPILVSEGIPVTIRDLHLKTNDTSGIIFSGKGNKLTLQNENSILVTGDAAGIYVKRNAELTIDTDNGFRASLDITMQSSNSYKPVGGAGIGGIKRANQFRLDDTWYAGDITILGGDIRFVSIGASGACIGGGEGGIVSSVTIGGSANITMDITGVSGYMAKQYAAAGIGSGSNVTYGNPLSGETQRIVIDGGSITGTTNGIGALIGTGTEMSTGNQYATEITINGGIINLTGNANDSSLSGCCGALIGAGYNAAGPTITINGGNITAAQDSYWEYTKGQYAATAAAIGTGMSGNARGGSVTINGGTVTATVTHAAYNPNPEKYPDNHTSAIGHGYYNGYSGSSITTDVVINNGSVKARIEGSDEPSISDGATNDGGETVYEVHMTFEEWPKVVILENGTPEGLSANIGGQHTGDQYSLYLWLTEADEDNMHIVIVQDIDNDIYYKGVTIVDGEVTIYSFYEFGLFLTHATPEDPDGTEFEFLWQEETGENIYVYNYYVREGGSVTVRIVPDDGYTFPNERTVYLVRDGFIVESGYTYDPETGTVTIEDFSGDTYFVASATVDKTALLELLQYAASLREEDYVQDDAWDDFIFEYAYAYGVYMDDTAEPGVVLGAYNVLVEAIARLQKLHDTAALEAAIEEASGLTGDYYTEETWADVEEALREAEAVLGDEDATQTEINEATKKLEKALEALQSNADKSELLAAIEQAGTLTEDVYTSATWENLQSALAEAESVYEDEAAIQPEVDAAKDALLEAIGALVERGDKTDLAAAIAEADALNEADYTAESWTTLTEALTAAKAVNDNADATQAEINPVKDALRAALDALVERGDKTDLAAAIAEADALNEADYTAESWTTLTEVLTAAKAVNDNVDATQADIDPVKDALRAALDALVERGDKTELEDTITDAEALKETDYPAEIWKALTDALAAAKAVKENPDATQEEIDAANAALEEVLEQLEKNPGNEPTGDVPMIGLVILMTVTLGAAFVFGKKRAEGKE